MLLFSPFEQFQILSLLTIKLFGLDLSITNALLINLIALFCFSSTIYFFNFSNNYLNESSFFFIPNNYQIKIKFKKTIITTFNEQTKLRFTTQKRSFNTHSIYKNISEYFSVILEDDKRFQTYFKKKFPKSFKYLPIIKLVTFFFILITLNMDYQTYSVFSSTILNKESSLTLASTKFYSQYSFCFYFMIVLYEFILSIYVIFKANALIKNVLFQIGKQAVKVISASSVVAVGYSHAPVESNVVSNFVHTKTPFGRGYDYEIGSIGLKVKGDLVSSALGHENMLSAAQKHAPDSSIIDVNKLNNIINDPEFKSKIRTNLTIVEKVVLGIPLVDTVFTITNPASSDVSHSNSLKGLSETNDDNTTTDESTTFVTKKSSIRKHHSEPSLLQKSKNPIIQRRNSR